MMRLELEEASPNVDDVTLLTGKLNESTAVAAVGVQTVVWPSSIAI